MAVDGKPALLAPAARIEPSNFVQPDGSFELRQVSAGEYRIGASIPGNLYLAGAWLGPRNIMGQPFEIDRNNSGPLLLELSGDGAKFEGTVTGADNSPAANAQVVLVPPVEFRDTFGVSKTAMTDKTGHFDMDGIRPGTYTVYAFSKIENNAWLNYAFMNIYRSAGLQITFGRGAQVYRDFKLAPNSR
jgi:hypothetical protein